MTAVVVFAVLTAVLIGLLGVHRSRSGARRRPGRHGVRAHDVGFLAGGGFVAGGGFDGGGFDGGGSGGGFDGGGGGGGGC